MDLCQIGDKSSAEPIMIHFPDLHIDQEDDALIYTEYIP